MRIIANYAKGGSLRFISHLDVQRLLQRAMRRANLPLAYSKGFNPHPIMAFASALAVGFSSEAEWLDVRLDRDMRPEEFMAALNPCLPDGFSILDAKCAPEELPALTALTHSALYEVQFDLEHAGERLTPVLSGLLSGPIVVSKRTKGGMRQVDIAPQVLDAAFAGDVLTVLGVLNVNGGLNMGLFLQALLSEAKEPCAYRVHRRGLYFENTDLFPGYIA